MPTVTRHGNCLKKQNNTHHMHRLLTILLLLLPTAAFGQPDKVYRSLSEVTNADEVYILHLRGKRLKTVPQEVYAMHNLRELCLRGNRITALSDSIALLQNLEKIELSRNPISALPSVMADMTQLRQLVLWDTRVTTLPVEFARLDDTLQLLDLRDCSLTLDEQKAIDQLLPTVKKLWDYACNCPTD